MRKVVVSLFLVVLVLVIFSFEVTYKFISSQLILEVERKGNYRAFIDDKSYNFTKILKVPWKRGKVDKISVEDLNTGETKEILIEGVRDEPPVVEIKVPESLGFGVYEITVNATDDWDSATSLKLRVLLDNVIYDKRVLDTFFLKEGSHHIEAFAIDSFYNVGRDKKTIEVNIDFPKPPEFVYRGSDEVVFSTPTDLFFIYPEEVGVLNDVKTLSRDDGKVLKALDEFGNKGIPFVITPLPGELNPLPEKTTLTTIMKNYLLLETGSPYVVLTKVVLPSRNSLVLGGNAVLDIKAGELFVKGILLNIAPGGKIIGGSLNIGEDAKIYLKELEVTSKMDVDGGKVVYLEKVTGQKELTFKNTKFLVVSNLKLDSLLCEGCGKVYVLESEVGNLMVEDSERVEVYNSKVDKMSISTFCNVLTVDSTITNLELSVLTKMHAFGSDISNITVKSGSSLYIRNSSYEKALIEGFSLMATFEMKEEGEAETKSSEIIRK